MWSAGIAHDWSQAACWPVTAWVAAEGGALELVELPRPLRCHPPHLFVFEAVGLDAPRSVVGRKAAEFVGFGARQGSSREGVASGTLWVDGAHCDPIAACLLGSKFTGQQCEPFLLVSARCHPSAGARCFDGASGVDHAGVVFRFPCGHLGRPRRECLRPC